MTTCEVWLIWILFPLLWAGAAIVTTIKHLRDASWEPCILRQLNSQVFVKTSLRLSISVRCYVWFLWIATVLTVASGFGLWVFVAVGR